MAIVRINLTTGVQDSSAENGFRNVIHYKHYSCNGEQDLYFETPIVTNSIRIVSKVIAKSSKLTKHRIVGYFLIGNN